MSQDTATEPHAELQLLLRTRAQLLRPDPLLITRALRLCAKHDPVTSRFTASGRMTPAGMLDLEDQHLPDVPVGGEDASIATAPTVVSESQGFPDEAIAAVGPQLPNRDPPSNAGRADLRRLGHGAHIAGYRIEGLLGKGGMGHVYRATQLSMNREVALKVLSPRLGGKKTFRDRFIREARNAGSFQHPNLIGVHDVGESEGLLFFSMELVDGISVKKLIKRDGHIDETRAYMICHQTLQALQYAHEQGIIHRDIKPDNLMLTKAGTVKVADLGLSRINDGRDGGPSSATRTGSMMGTPYYMPPEQGRDASKADHRADLYALGASLFHMVCGVVPFNGSTPMEVLMRAATNDLVFTDPAPSNGMQLLIRTLMAKDPAGRPQSAGEAIRLVEKLSGLSSTQMGLTTRGTTVDRQHQQRRRRSLGFAIPAVLLGLLVAVGIGIWRHYQGPGQINAAWTQLKKEVGQDVIDQHYSAAISRLDAFATEHPHPGSVIAGQRDHLRDSVKASWSKWCLENQEVYEALKHIDSMIYGIGTGESDPQTVEDAIGKIRSRPEVLSPWVLSELERLELDLDKQRQRIAVLNDWLLDAQFTPPIEARLDGSGPIILPLTGVGAQALLRPGRLTLNRHLKLPENFRLAVTVSLERADICQVFVGDHERDTIHRIDITSVHLVLRQIDPERVRLGAWTPRRGGRDAAGAVRDDRRPPRDDLGVELFRVPHDGTAAFDLVWSDKQLELRFLGQDGNIAQTVTVEHDIRNTTPVVFGWRAQSTIRLDIKPSL